jgi:hypothetical protein
MDMITPSAVISRVEAYFEGGVLAYLSPREASVATAHVTPRDALEAPRTNAGEAAVVPAPGRAILIQQASGPCLEMLATSHARHEAYARRHGLAFWSVRGAVQQHLPPYWDKIPLIMAALRLEVDLVVWLDADTLIVDLNQDLRRALSGGAPIGMCRHEVPWEDQAWHFNAGVIVVRNTEAARWFFRQVWERGPTKIMWQEQGRMLHLLRAHPELVQTLDNKWNSAEGVNESPCPVIRAWHGWGSEAVAAMRDALAGLEPL